MFMKKRINLIVKGEGLIAEVLKVRERKINRAVESAADFAEEQVLDAEAEALKAIEKMGASADNSEALKAAINEYCEALDKKDAFIIRGKQIEALKAALLEEVSDTENVD